MNTRIRVFLGALALTAAATACGTEAKKHIAKSAVKTMPAAERRDSFEATARMLDEDPHLVDELYLIVRQHRPMMQRFLVNASADLKEPWLAGMAGAELAQHPDAVEQSMVSAMDEIAKEPKARAAMDRALSKRAAKSVDILTDDPNTLAQVLGATMTAIENKPKAKQNVLAATRLQRKQIIAFVKSDPELGKEMTEELLREAVKDKPTLEKMLRAVGAIDDDRPGDKKR